MDAAVHEDTARELRVCDEKARRVEFVAGLGTDYGGAANKARGEFAVGVAIGGIKAAGETAKYFLVSVRAEGGAIGCAD